MKLDDIHSLWTADAGIDKEALETAALDIPKLHAKYLRILSDERMILKTIKAEIETLKANKRDWYSGAMSKEDLDALGWQQNPLRILRQDVERYVDTDKDVIAINLRRGLQEEKVDVVIEILKSINNRTFQIGHAIAWEKFKNGIN